MALGSVQDLDAEKHLKDGRLTVLCDVTVTGLRTEDHVEAAAPEPTDVEPPFGMRGGNEKEVDVQIEVGGETLPAHRRILEAASPIFKADLSLASATAGDTSSTALLRVDDMDAEVLKAVLQFIYMGSPPLPLEKTMAERLLVAADRYGLEKLKPICEEALCRHVDMSSVAATLALAERHHCSVLRAACMQFLASPGNLQAFMATDGFEQLRTGCPTALLDLVLKKITVRSN
ncbi:BTB/POZ and MATH domain-containing protein 2-like [Aegilops tauschii subsp. strangulata]|uniref:BTB/POZ and MATH domain-containing protein 2-like n=1 Tax=Aegilops tauschii subsp. strangulata TaxID=200361 RepID=UPI003CC8A06C